MLLCGHKRSMCAHDMHVCKHACMHIQTQICKRIHIYCTWTHWKDKRSWEKESEATHWHVSLKFHLLCHCLTNCSTYSKHSSQQLGSKWGLHTPYKISIPCLTFKKKILFLLLSPSLSFSLPCMVSIYVVFLFFFSRAHITINTDIKAKFSIHIILPMIMSHISTTKQTICESLMSVLCEAMGYIEMLKTDSMGIIMSCKQAWHQRIQHHAPLWFSHGLSNETRAVTVLFCSSCTVQAALEYFP